MKAYLINPNEESITEVEVEEPTYLGIQKHIDAELFTVVRISLEDDVYVSDTGLYDGSWERHGWFHIENYPTSLAGLGLIMSHNVEGDSLPPTLPKEDYKIDYLPIQTGEPIDA